MARGEAVLEKEGCGQVKEGEVSAGPEVVSGGLRYCGMSFPWLAWDARDTGLRY